MVPKGHRHRGGAFDGEGDKDEGLVTPRTTRSGDQVIKGRETPVLSPQDVREFRSGMMRLWHLGTDRACIQEATRC